MIHRGGVRIIIWVCAIFYLLQHIYSPTALKTFGLASFDNPNFSVMQLVSYGFLHGNAYHICVNIILLAMFGSRIQNLLGTWNFLMLFLISVIGGGCIQTLTSDFNQVTIGASGGVFGVMLAFSCLFPREKFNVLFTSFSVSAFWIVMFYVVSELYFILYSPVTHIAHYAHLGGATTGLLFGLIWRKSLSVKNNA
jgi:membrane associated rhomboid family serine protease